MDIFTLFFAFLPATKLSFSWIGANWSTWAFVVVGLVFLLNWKSWPFVWHVQVLSYAARYYILSFFLTPARVLRANPSTHANPFVVRSTRRYWSGVDDLDWKGRVSNSVYARSLDSARGKGTISLYAPILMTGGWFGVGSTNYVFLKPLSPFQSYEIEVRLGGFDEKWMHLLAVYLTPGPSKSTSGAAKASTIVSNGPKSNGSIESGPDGKVVHCVAVSSICWKIGRLTIPPSVVLSFAGYGKASNWARTEKLIKAGRRARQAWLRGGWKIEGGVAEEFEEEGRIRMGELGGLRGVVAGFARG